jgi:hypothetical protein
LQSAAAGVFGCAFAQITVSIQAMRSQTSFMRQSRSFSFVSHETDQNGGHSAGAV